MSIEDDRELFLLLGRGLLETFCSELDFDGSRFGVTPSLLPSRGTGPRLVLDFSEAEFERAVVVTEESAESLWPDRPPRRRAVQLMLVHADEQIATTPAAPDTYVMTLPDGYVAVHPSASTSSAVDAAVVEEKRLRGIIDDGSTKGQTFEWR